jgi:alpha-L-fucosidase
MKELLTGYGSFFELWWDGANGEGPNGKKQVYDFTRFKDSALSYQPKIQIFSDIGPHIRWIGNENGIINETNWNLLDTIGFKRGEGAPPNDTLNRGNYNGKHWIGAEADVSIKPGWFYHPNEESKVKTPRQLLDIYFRSVGHGGNLILNVPPNRAGLITPEDSASLINFKKLRDSSFANNTLKNASKLNTYNGVSYSFNKPTKINTVVLKEKIAFGQRVSSFEILGSTVQGQYFHLAKGTTIGHKRIIRFPTTEVRYIQVVIKEAKATPIISSVEAY